MIALQTGRIKTEINIIKNQGRNDGKLARTNPYLSFWGLTSFWNAPVAEAWKQFDWRVLRGLYKNFKPSEFIFMC